MQLGMTQEGKHSCMYPYKYMGILGIQSILIQ